jgi:hypothetical protein
MNSQEKNHKLNAAITKRVIQLHALGYDCDFLIMGQGLLCIQSNQNFPVDAVLIKVVDQGYDQLTHSFKYVHTIDTNNGEKGVMITDAIFNNDLITS